MKCPHCGVEMSDGARFCGACGRTISSTQEVSHAGQQSSSTAEAPSLIGREIAGRYRVNAKLGEGGMGAVYKAEQMSLRRTVAVKLLRPEVASSQLLLARFNAEAQAVAKLSHPNTVNIYDFGQDSDGTLFIAMEFIEGKSLRQVIHAEAPLPVHRALGIASQIAASLVDAHHASIVHRDLKPDNVMLQERGKQRDVVRVLDFGIAKLRDEGRQTQMAMTQAGDMLGTPQYMAPEQIRAEQIDGRTDVYALGCIVYEMVTGRLPFEGSTVMALLSKHLMEPIVLPSQRRPELNLPPAIDQLVLAAMAKDPNARPATMEQMGEHISAVLASLPPATQDHTAQVVAQSGAMAMTPTPHGQPPTGQPGMAPARHPGMAPTALPGVAPAGHPQAFVPTPSSNYVPQGNAAPYDPHANRDAAPPAPSAPKSSSSLVWIILGTLVVAGTGAGIYFGALKKDEPSATRGASVDPTFDPEAEKPLRPDDPLHAPPPPPDPNVNDPWSGGGGNSDPTPTAPSNAVKTIQGIAVVLPPGFTVVQSTADQWAAADVPRGLAVMMVTLPPGPTDVSVLAHEYASTQNLTIIGEEDSIVAGKPRKLVAFQGKVGDDDAIQAGTILVGPSYRAIVIFHIQQSALLKDKTLGSVADDFFLHNIFTP